MIPPAAVRRPDQTHGPTILNQKATLQYHHQSTAAGVAKALRSVSASLGRLGFEGRYDYAAIGSVANLSARLCAEALDGQVLVSQAVAKAVDRIAIMEPLAPMSLKGFDFISELGGSGCLGPSERSNGRSLTRHGSTPGKTNYGQSHDKLLFRQGLSENRAAADGLSLSVPMPGILRLCTSGGSGSVLWQIVPPV